MSPGRVSQIFPVQLGRPRALEVRASPEYGSLLEKSYTNNAASAPVIQGPTTV